MSSSATTFACSSAANACDKETGLVAGLVAGATVAPAAANQVIFGFLLRRKASFEGLAMI